MRRLFTIAFKDLHLLTRDKFGLFWVTVFPLLFAVFFGTIFSGSGGGSRTMKIAIVDEDQTSYSEDFIKKLGESPSLRLVPTTRDSAFSLVRRGKLAAFVAILEGFGNTRGMMFGGGPATIEIGIDPSRQADAGILQGQLARISFGGMLEKFSNPQKVGEEFTWLGETVDTWTGLDSGQKKTAKRLLGDMGNLFESFDSTAWDDTASVSDTVSDGTTASSSSGLPAGLPIKTTSVIDDRVGPRSGFEIFFPTAVMWGLLGCAATFGASLVRERQTGTLLRLRLAPLSRGYILAGKGLSCFIACFAICIMLIIIGHYVFGVRITNYVHLTMALISCSLCFVGIMMGISVMGKTEEAVSGAGWGVLLVLSMIGGAMVPAFVMPDWLKTVSFISPIRWGLIAIEGAIWRDYTFSEMLFPVGVLLAFGAVCFTIGVIIFSRRDS